MRTACEFSPCSEAAGKPCCFLLFLHAEESILQCCEVLILPGQVSKDSLTKQFMTQEDCMN